MARDIPRNEHHVPEKTEDSMSFVSVKPQTTSPLVTFGFGRVENPYARVCYNLRTQWVEAEDLEFSASLAHRVRPSHDLASRPESGTLL